MKNDKRRFLFACCLLIIIFAVSCARTPRSAQSESSKYGTVTDSQGRIIAIPEKIEKTIILNSICYAMLQIIGASDTVIGTQFPNLKSAAPDLQNFGTWTAPNVERIIEAAPDVVLAYSRRIPDESARQIEEAGITLVFFDFFVPSGTAREIIELGRLYRNEGAAKEYVAFLDQYYNLINGRLSDIKNEERKTVYFESYGDYASVSKGSGAQEMIDAAGCINIAAEASVPYPKVSDEWILGHDPDIIVKSVSSNDGIMGTDVTDTAGAEKFYQALLNRSGWNGLYAVKNKKFILMDPDMASSPEGSIAGVLTIAKLAYPDRFRDIDTAAVYAEMQSRFFNNKNPRGLMLYPQGYP
jgi:iron complex transport system substrate-binding protein